MKELLEFIVRSIASNPDEVKVTESREDNGNKVLLQLEVSPNDKNPWTADQVKQSITNEYAELIQEGKLRIIKIMLNP